MVAASMRAPFLAAWMIALISGVDGADAVTVLHHVARVVAVGQAAHRPVVPSGKDRLIAHDHRADVLAGAGGSSGHHLGDVHEVFVPRSARHDEGPSVARYAGQPYRTRRWARSGGGADALMPRAKGSKDSRTAR